MENENDMELMCRICIKLVNDGEAKNLFAKINKSLLYQILQLTGNLLENSDDLPQYICPQCQEDLKRAQLFRERVLKSLKYFTSEEYKTLCKVSTKNVYENVINEYEEIEIEFISVDKMEKISSHPDKPNPTSNINEVKENSEVKNDEKKQEVESKESNEDNYDIKFEEDELTEVKPTTFSKNENTKPEKKPSEKNISIMCEQCGNHIIGRRNFTKHLKRHAGDRQYSCEFCPKQFFTSSEMQRHMRRHTGERPFGCKHCGRSFSHLSTLIWHERTHTNERPFACTQCNKAFFTAFMLKNHMLVHSGERSFECSVCNKAFQRQVHLTVHCRSIIHKQNEEKQKLGLQLNKKK